MTLSDDTSKTTFDSNNEDDEVFVFPASFAQQRLWFLDQFEPGSPYYNIPIVVRLRGKFDIVLFEKAINEIVSRHEILRTTFASIDGKPVQVISPELYIPIKIIEVSGEEAKIRYDHAIGIARDEARHNFSLSKGPLFTITVVKLDERDHLISLVMHHIISDGWSIGVFIREMSVFYDALMEGHAPNLAPLSLQYADYSEWQRDWMQGEVLDAQLEYWRNQLENSPSLLELPTDRPRPAVQTNRGGNASIHIPHELMTKVIELSRKENATLFMTLLAAMNILLHKYSGQTDLCIGTPIANRTRAEIEPLIGLFINTLVIRTNISPQDTPTDVIKKVKQASLGAYAHQDLPFEMLVDNLDIERDMSYSPVFQVMFILQNAQNTTGLRISSDLVLEQVEIDAGTATFDLSFSVTEQPKFLEILVEYNSDLFDHETIERLLVHLEILLDRLVQNPDESISNLSLLNDVELETVIRTWNNTPLDLPEVPLIHQLFRKQAERTPHAIAVSQSEGGSIQELTYQDLDMKSDFLAGYLIDAGLKVDDLVGLCLEKSIELMVAILGILKAGCGYLPLDPAYPDERLFFMVDDSKTRVILTQESFREKLETSPANLVMLNEGLPITADDHAVILEKLSARGISPDNLAYVIYTSGSTGTPKGVMVTHRGVVNHNLSVINKFALNSSDRVLQFATINFDTAVEEIFPTWLAGATLVLPPKSRLTMGMLLLSSKEITDLVTEEAITVLDLPTAFWHEWVQQQFLSAQQLPESLRLIILGGEKAYRDRYDTWAGLNGGRVKLLNTYGPTEGTIIATSFDPSGGFLHDHDFPIGTPLHNVNIYILDSSLKPLPVNVPGELFIAGTGVARGYLNQPILTDEKFLPSPFIAGECMYRTGDRARWLRDGNLEYIGRVDSQVKVRGFRIETGEIETIIRQFEGVRDNAVIPYPIQRLSAGAQTEDHRLVGYLVVEGFETQDQAVMINQLKDYLRKKLPDYMIPSTFLFIEKIPLTPNGKVDRKNLPHPDIASRSLEVSYLAPRNLLEKKLLTIWETLLGNDRIGVLDNFFELGGHSLLATQVVSRIKSDIGIDIPLRLIFEAPSISMLAQRIEAENLGPGNRQYKKIIPYPISDKPIPLSFAQQRLWFLDQLEPGSSNYNLPESVIITGPVDVNLFDECINEIIQRHTSLRTVFSEIDGAPVQIILPEMRIAITQDDCSYLPPGEREISARDLALEEVKTPFNLTEGPLLRVHLIKLGLNETILLITMHHIVSDAWSTRVFVGEFVFLYKSKINGLAAQLPDLDIQYKDFAQWQRNWLAGEVLAEQVEYWKTKLGGLPGLLELPTDRPRPPVQSFVGTYKTFSFSKEISQKITDMAKRHGVTNFMVLLAGFDTLLNRYTNQDGIAVGTPIANRNRAEIENLIGFFVNTLVIRSDFSEELTFVDLLDQIRENTLEAYAHQDLPFEMIVDAVQPQRNLSHSPIFQVMFAMQTQGSVVDAKNENSSDENFTIRPYEVHSETSKFDLTLFMMENEGVFQGAWEFNTDLFEPSTIDRMIVHFTNLMSGILADPSQKIWEIPLIGPDEYKTLIHEWNETLTPIPDDKFAHQFFEDQVIQNRESVAVMEYEYFNGGLIPGKEYTYQELNERANQLAHWLVEKGVGPGKLVGIFLHRSFDLVMAILGVLKAGGAYVPIDPIYPPDRVWYMLEDSQSVVVITSDILKNRLLQKQSDVFTQNFFCIDSEKEMLAHLPSKNLDTNLTREDLAYVIYTSGSTGNPKGTMVIHHGLTNYLSWCLSAYPVHNGQGSPVHSSISFDLTITSLYTPLISGKKVILLPEELGVEALGELLLADDNFSLVKITPAHLHFLGQQLETAANHGETKSFIIGGENLLIEHIQYWRKYSPDSMLVNEYGPTETVVGCCVYTVPREQDFSGIIPIGKPIINTRLYVLDAHGQPVPIGVPGELYIGGYGVARGYLHQPELTQEKFLPDPFNPIPGSRMYRTGDLVKYLPDGNLVCLGRMDFQVKIRGFRVELGEIEALINKQDNIGDVCVWIHEDSVGKRLVAYLVPVDCDQGINLDQLRTLIKEKLPDYMVPTAFVIMENLPLTPNGKIDRNRLPTPEFITPLEIYVAPRTAEEKLVASVWEEVLGITRIGARDSFFDLGGHSLLATQVASRLRQRLGSEIPLRLLFEAPTVEELARRISAEQRGTAGIRLPALTKLTERYESVPISFAQERLWFLDQLMPESAQHNIPIAVRIVGDLDPVMLEKCLKKIIERHEVFRASFINVPNADSPSGYSVVQIVDPEFKFKLNRKDFSHLDPESRYEKVMIDIRNDVAEPFNLKRAPLFRTILYRLSTDDHIFYTNTHHIITDDWSLGIFIDEVVSFYNLLVSGNDFIDIQDIEFQYSDFSSWQRKWFRGEIFDEQFNYWKKELQGLPPLLELPLDNPRPAVQTFRGERLTTKFRPELINRLRDLNRKEGTTLFMSLLGLLNVLLFRYSNQDEFAIGTPIAGRNHIELENIIGFFVNTLVIRADVDGTKSFLEHLSRVRESTLGAYAHQDMPFENLVSSLNVERDMSHSPIFQVMFVLQNAPRKKIQIGDDLGFELIDIYDQLARYDLTFTVIEDENSIQMAVEYNSDLFNQDTIQRMLDHYTLIMNGVVSDPTIPIGSINLLSEEERELTLIDWNRTDRMIPAYENTISRFEEIVDRYPEKDALIFSGSERMALTYEQLDKRSNQLAHYLLSEDIKPESFVAVYTERSLEMIVGILGIMKAGGAYIPIDPRYPQSRIEYMLNDAQPELIITQHSLQNSIDHLDILSICLDTEWEKISKFDDTRINVIKSLDQLAYVIYTSGSTGNPKGVLLRHQGLLNLIFAVQDSTGISDDDKLLQFAAFSFDASVVDIFLALGWGMTLCLAPQEIISSALDLHKLIIDEEISIVTLPPSMLAVMSDENLESLRIVISAGEACKREIVDRWAPGRRFINGYGPTETTVAATMGDCFAEDQHPPRIGKPILNFQVYVVDENLQPVPIGVPGELVVGGVGLARGYLNRPELTKEKFVPDPFTNDQAKKIYRTGDRVRWCVDGTIEYLGRIDEQVKIRGFRIELGEIEENILSVDGILQAVVVKVANEEAGDRLVAYLVVEHPDDFSIETLRSHLRSNLPEYMVPATFNILDALPLTPSGKIDKKNLPVPEFSHREVGEDFAYPDSEDEITLAGIWAKLIKLDRISIDDNFFEIGGDSILSIHMITLANDAGIDITPRQVFRFPTIRTLLANAGSDSIDAEQGLVSGRAPFSPIQERFFLNNWKNPNHMNVSLMLAVFDKLDRSLLETTIKVLIQHHDILRARFYEDTNGWGLWIDDRLDETPFVYQEIVGVDDTDLVRIIETTASQHQMDFNITQPPLMKVVLMRMEEGIPDRLLFVFHHLIFDPVSFRIFLNDFMSVYAQLSSSNDPVLPPKTTSVLQWNKSLVEFAQSERVKSQIDFWESMYQNFNPLSVDLESGSNLVLDSRNISATLDAEKTSTLIQRIRKDFKVSVDEILITILGKVFTNWTQDKSILIEVLTHGREMIMEKLDASRTIGWFVTSYPLQVAFDEDLTIEKNALLTQELLSQIKDNGIHFGLLRYLCADEEIQYRLRHKPKPDIMFNYLGQFDQMSMDEDNEEAIPAVPATENKGPDQHPYDERESKINIIASITSGELNVSIGYSQGQYREETIRRLVVDFMTELKNLAM